LAVDASHLHPPSRHYRLGTKAAQQDITGAKSATRDGPLHEQSAS
jgi:hypothetical protein